MVGLLEGARRDAGLSQGELARLAQTSRTTLSAYENGRTSPTLTTAARVLSACGFVLAATRQVRRGLLRGRAAWPTHAAASRAWSPASARPG
ncbi:MAG: helix-turn-helix transcriptional regulator [Pseudorhodobacter sp.]|nr:helix-turn-helix transcriptional regulator [Frankiaceae bacterium]